jgi:L-alanine-DL-glutamate epimerase-like enolase superfamily enzyme
VKLDVRRRTLRLGRPLRTSYGELGERELLAVSVIDRSGVSGHGEAAPLSPYDGVSVERVERALARYTQVLASCEDAHPDRLLEACRAADDQPAALAAIDLALWDRAGRLQGKPVARLLSERPAGEVPVNAILPALDRAGVGEQAAAAAREGYECVKMKVGVGDDAARVAAARAAGGPRLALRLDAIGAWSVAEAVRAIDALAPAGLELVEEPVHGLAAVREVRERVAVRIAIDETAAEPGALGAGVADAVCLKIARCGGISALLAASALVRAHGGEVYLASTMDGPLGIAAALHAAAALAAHGPLAHCGLATLALFDGLADPLPARFGRIALPPGPGLGVEPL